MTRNTIILPLNSDAEFNRGTVEPLPSPPGNLLANPGNTQISLTWTAIYDVIGYRLYYSTSSFSAIDDPGVTQIKIEDPLATAYTLTGLSNGVKYYIRMLSVSGAGYGALSSEINSIPSTYTNVYSTVFDGSTELVNFGDIPAFHFASASTFTVVAWVKWIDTFGGQQTIVSNTIVASANVGFNFYKAGGEQLEAELRYNLANRIRVQTTEQFANLDEWYHVAVTYDGSGLASGMKLYINGVIGTLTILNDTLVIDVNNWDNWTIGARPNASDYHLGNLDEIAVYDATLSATDIAEIYNLGVPINLINLDSGVDLVSWWRMGDGDTNTTIIDNAGTNDGTLVNMDASNYVEDVP